MSQCDYSFVILSYNRRQKLAITLDRLANLTGSSCYEVIVVDNASTDGTLAMLAEKYASARVLPLTKNVGIAAWNEGLQVAQGRWIFVLDDDSLPLTNTFLEDFAAKEPQLDPRMGICGLNVFWDEAGTDSWGEGWLNRSHVFLGCGVALRREMVQVIGGFDSHFFVYSHELDYSLKALHHGYSKVDFQDVKIWHNSDKRSRYDDFWMYHTLKGMLYTVLKWMPMPYMIKGLAIQSFLYLPSALRSHTVRAWARAHLTLLREFYPVMKTRTPLSRELHLRLSQQWLDGKPRSFWVRLLCSKVWIA